MKRKMHAKTMAIVLATTTVVQATGVTSQLLNGVPFEIAHADVTNPELVAGAGQTTSASVTVSGQDITGTAAGSISITQIPASATVGSATSVSVILQLPTNNDQNFTTSACVHLSWRVDPNNTNQLIASGTISHVNGYNLGTTLDYTFTTTNAEAAVEVDKTALTDAITAATTNSKSVSVGTDGSDVLAANKWVTAAVEKTYTDAIAAAQVIADKTDSTQTEIDSAVVTLGTATTAFNTAEAAGTKVVTPAQAKTRITVKVDSIWGNVSIAGVKFSPKWGSSNIMTSLATDIKAASFSAYTLESVTSDGTTVTAIFTTTDELSSVPVGFNTGLDWSNGHADVSIEPITTNTNVDTSTTTGAAVSTGTTTGAAVSVNDSDFKFDTNTGTITGYNGSETEVAIPSEINGVNVKGIGNYAFYNCGSLTSITIPNNVTSIGNYAFCNCSNLTSITIPNSVTSITIPNDVTSIGDYAFCNCGSLTSITIPNNVTSIGNYAFCNCGSLTSIIIPNNVTSIGNYAFCNCSSLTSITMPNSVTSIGMYGFSNCENALFHVESQEVKQLLLNFGVDENKIILNSEPSTNTTTGSTTGSAVSVDKSELQTLYDDHKDDTQGSYTNASWSIFTTKLNNAETVINDNAATQDEVNTAKTDLNNAVNGLVKTSTTTGAAVTVDKTALTDAITAATTNSESVAVSTDGSDVLVANKWVTAAAEKIYTDAIAAAQVIADKTDSTQTEVDSAVVTLGTATTAFNTDEVAGTKVVTPAQAKTRITVKVTSLWGNISIAGVNFSAKWGSSNLMTSLAADIKAASFTGYTLESVTSDGATVTAIFTTTDELSSVPAGFTKGLDWSQGYANVSIEPITTNTNVDTSTTTGAAVSTGITTGAAVEVDKTALTDAITAATTNSKSVAVSADGSDVLVANKWVTAAVEKTYTDAIAAAQLIDDKADSTQTEVDNAVGALAAATTAFNNAEAAGIQSDFEFDTNTGTITKYNGSKTEVAIPSEINGVNVTSIAQEAFINCSNLTSITIPNSVTSIGDAAFYGCSNLASITIPSSVTSIGVYAFEKCSKLTSIIIPNSVTSIGQGTFYDCSNLTSITIPNSVTSVGLGTFYNCSNLTSITIPDSVTSIGQGAFYNCSNLTSITIPSSVTSIGFSEFEKCSSLTSITIPSSVTSIGDYAFHSCNFKNITIPNSVTSIGKYAFENCSNLTSITIPDSVTSIGDYAFYSCNNLTGIIIPNGVTSIGFSEFEKCSSLTSITIPSSVTSIGDYAFHSCNFKNITIPNSVTSIGKYAFENCSNLTSITIPDSVASIGDYAFYSCNNLTGIIIPNSVTSIGQDVFINCENALFYVESQEVKQLLLNCGVDENKIILNSQPSTNTTTSTTTDAAVTVDKAALTDAITAATTNSKSVSVSTDGSDVLVANKWVKAADEKTYTDAIAAAQAIADKTNATQTEVDNAVGALKIATTVFNTAEAVGTKVVAADKTALTDAITAATTNSKSVATSTNGSDVLVASKWVTAAVKKTYTDAIAAAQVIADKTDATQTEVDNAVGALKIATTAFNTAEAAGTKTSSSSSSGSGSSSSSSSSSSSTSTATSTSSTGTTTTTTTATLTSSTGTTTATTGTTTTVTSPVTAATIQSILTSNGTAPVTKDSIAAAITTIGVNNTVDPTVAKEIAKEVAKVVTANIVSDLSATVGQGVTASVAKEVTTTDGNTLSVSTLTKDSASLGAVITAAKGSATTTIPMDTTAGNITAVYKFVPLLGKYIQVTDGVTIGTNTVTLPTQANATYVAVANQLDSTDTVAQGWAQVNNNWYMVNKTGDPQTGWQKDSTGWVYLSPSNAAMQTGWNKQGDTWYKLGSNGYMQTGWVKDGNDWYYMNNDGSMASNTTVDGYTLGSNGAWIG